MENWRRAWQEGDLSTYVACYHPSFEAKKMDLQAWGKYKSGLFSRSTKRNVLLRDIYIQESDSTAVITFKQRYETAGYQAYGVKILYLERHQGHWAILEEHYKPFPDVAAKVDKSILGGEGLVI